MNINLRDIINNGSDSMTHNDLIEILLSNNVYDELKQREKELFGLIP